MWYVLLALFVFGVLIFIHEFGHFICARLCKVDIKEFAIGMGPTILKWRSKKYDTDYSLRLFPIGGYVS
ncbi:MAG: site-2 protease family protein, partial [Clostridia bacterium]|nr:site-2 protease family protein [Clostridia bacterium]